MNTSSHPRDLQPGLEVAPSSEPQVFYRATDKYVVVPTAPATAHPAAVPYASEEETLPLARLEHGSRRKLYVIIGTLIALAIVLGATVGGVLGSKALRSNNSEAAQASTSPPSPNTTTPSPSTTTPSPNTATSTVNTTAVRPGTRLSVTGRRIPGNGFTSRLFWQGGDGLLRTSRYTSSIGGSWSSLLVFASLDAQQGTPLAATLDLVYPQFEVFYLDSSSTFRGINFGEDETEPKPDSVETEWPAFAVYANSRMAAYWPYVVVQNRNATFRRQVYKWGWFNDTLKGWFDPDVVPLGDDGTGIAVVPVVKEFKEPYAEGIAYRDQNGWLSVFSFGGDDRAIGWKSGSLNMATPTGTAIASFAVGRHNSNTTNTWILYQDDNNKIQAVWQEDANGWRGPQEVGEADAGTDIACLTEQTGDQPSQVPLSEQTDMRRCYYQYQGVIREKRLTSSSWVDGDTIPME